MPKYEAVSPNRHRSLRFHSKRSAALGDSIASVPIIPIEFGRLIESYPIFISKNARTGQFQFSILLGFAADENLYLTQENWGARYVPLHLQRMPFHIGEPKADNPDQLALLIDVESPRIDEAGDCSVYNADGSLSEETELAISILAELSRGAEETEEVISSLAGLDLIVPTHVQFETRDGRQTIEGLYSIDEEKLCALKPDRILELFSSGTLRLINVLLSSHVHVGGLVERKLSVLAHR